LAITGLGVVLFGFVLFWVVIPLTKWKINYLRRLDQEGKLTDYEKQAMFYYFPEGENTTNEKNRLVGSTHNSYK